MLTETQQQERRKILEKYIPPRDRAVLAEWDDELLAVFEEPLWGSSGDPVHTIDLGHVQISVAREVGRALMDELRAADLPFDETSLSGEWLRVQSQPGS
jgi:hypothetical protein